MIFLVFNDYITHELWQQLGAGLHVITVGYSPLAENRDKKTYVLEYFITKNMLWTVIQILFWANKKQGESPLSQRT